jgi:hypothetical protein
MQMRQTSRQIQEATHSGVTETLARHKLPRWPMHSLFLSNTILLKRNMEKRLAKSCQAEEYRTQPKPVYSLTDTRLTLTSSQPTLRATTPIMQERILT